MNMKKLMIAIAALTLMVMGCSSGDDDSGVVTPEKKEPVDTTQTIKPGTDVRPHWEGPNYNLFEQYMAIDVLLQDTLAPYASDQDLMAAFIDNEVRGVSGARQSGEQWIFPLVVASNESNVPLRLSYYCDKLHRIFTIDWINFDAALPPTGKGGTYQPAFVK